AKMDMENCFRVAAHDASHYYQLAYYADKKGEDGWRRISVQMTTPGAVAHARNGYFYHRNPRSDPGRDVDMKIALASPLESNAIPLKLHWLQREKNQDRIKVNFELWMPGSAASIDTYEKNRIQLAIVGLAKTMTGKLEDSFEQQFAGELPENVVSQLQ